MSDDRIPPVNSRLFSEDVSRRDLLKRLSILALLNAAGVDSPIPGLHAAAEGVPVDHAKLLGEWLTEKSGTSGIVTATDSPGLPNLNWAWSDLSGKSGLVGGGDGEPLFLDALSAALPAKGDFSIVTWLHTLGNDTGVVGDLLSKFNPATRQGFQLSVVANVGVTNAQSNLRQLQFGLDQGTEPVISDCGRPGQNVYIFSLVSHRGELYCSTCEPGADQTGHVYRYLGTDQWEDCGSPDRCNAVSAMATVNGELYVGTARYNLGGSSLTPSLNETPGGGVYRYVGGQKWESCGRIGQSPAVFGLVNFRGTLVASSLYAPAGVYAYAGGEKWNYLGTAEGDKRVEALTVFRGQLYGTGFNAGEIYRYEGGTNWKTVGVLPETTQTYGFAIYQGELYVSTWPTAIVYKYISDGVWEPCGRPGQELESMPLAIYNGKMYTGTLPLGELYRFEGESNWTRLAQLDQTPDVKYRRAWSMAVHQGKLYCGTLPSGHVFSIQVGNCVTADLPLQEGWIQIAAVRRGAELKLFINGEKVATNTVGEVPLDLTNETGWRLGGGNHSSLRGGLRALQIYEGALSDAAVAELYRTP